MTKSKIDLPGWPRGLREPLAAAYVGLSSSGFRTEWKAGRAPLPVRLTERRQVWLRDALDRWLDAKAGLLSSDCTRIAPQVPMVPIQAYEMEG
jgi:predicted DNA-binding transcriptional regulator AlpA